MKKRIEIYSLIVGLVFLVSGMAKALDIAIFSKVITQYGFENLYFISPLIVMAEVLIGLLLVFQLWQRWSAFAGVVLVFGFTLIYTYGLVFKGIEDCGCFGKITALNTSPVFTFVRNAVLIYLLIAVWRKGENRANINKWIIVTALIFMCLVSFMSGYSFRYVGKSKKPKEYQAQAVKGSILNEFVTTSNDSTYLVFVFTYSCAHCLNSIANLKEYEQSGVVDKVVGLAIGDSVIGKKFAEDFKPNFPVKNYSKELLRLTNDFPTAYYIKKDSIIAILSGELPCSYVFNLSYN